MAESKGELPNTPHSHSQNDGEIHGKLPQDLSDKESTKLLCDSEQGDDDDSITEEDLSNDRDIYCDPCGEDGKCLTATGFCVDCNDFLCLDCFQNHRKPKPMRHHVLQDKKNMPQTKSTATKERQNECHCLTHQGHILLFYCTKHDSVLCKLCQQFDHRQCQKNGNLIDLDQIVLETDQLTDVQCQITALEEELVNNKTISTHTGENIKVSYARVVNEITEIKESDLQMTKDISVTCDNMLLDVVSMGEDLKSLSSKKDKLQLFLKLKKAQTMVKTFERNLIQVRNDNKNFEYIFFSEDQRNKNFGKMGTLMKSPIETETVNVKTETDTTDCQITGIARLSEDKYAIADFTNNKVKRVDLTSKMVTLDFKLDMSPYVLTKIDESKIAVTTFCYNSIILISISDTITAYTTIGRCDQSKGIAVINDNLVVSCGNPNEIQVRTLDGKIKHTISDKDEDGFVKFGDARYISHGVDTNTIYLTDVKGNKILSMTLDGEVLARFTHEYLVNPRGITCSRDGRIFVCSLGSHMIFEISSDLSQGQVILGKGNGIFQPFSIFFSEEKQQLLVGSKGKNNIQIFQL